MTLTASILKKENLLRLGGDVDAIGNEKLSFVFNKNGLLIEHNLDELFGSGSVQSLLSRPFEYQNLNFRSMTGAGVDISWGDRDGGEILGTNQRDRIEITSRGETIVNGGAGSDRIISRAGSDSLEGGRGHDKLIGGGGDDTMVGGKGNDVIIGGSGSDTIIFSGNRSDYDITKTGDRFTIKQTEGGLTDGTDTIYGVENFVFADGDVGAADLMTPTGMYNGNLSVRYSDGGSTTFVAYGEFNIYLNVETGVALIGGIVGNSRNNIEFFADGTYENGIFTTHTGCINIRDEDGKFIRKEDMSADGTFAINGDDELFSGTVESLGNASGFTLTGSYTSFHEIF